METKTEGADKRVYIALFVIIVLAAVVRVNLLGLHRLHMDECLYSAYSIRMVTKGDLLLNGGLQVDKPPLFFYAIAASFLINGISENAARIPNIIFSLFTIFFIYKFANILFRKKSVSLLSAYFAAFSVMFVLFSTTAFQDISMIMFFMWALIAAKDGRFKLSAALYACSIACKPMTIFLFPIYAWFIFDFAGFVINKKNLKDFFVGISYVFIPLILWSVFAANPRFGIFKFFITQQPEAMSVSFDIAGRAAAWMAHIKYLMNGFYYSFAAAGGTLFLIVFFLVNRRKEEAKPFLFLFASIVYI
ncbi:MAG TPA: hypothetical protein ENN43_03595, partial [bacterium]|nr:hypothetical protein [bacterium]